MMSETIWQDQQKKEQTLIGHILMDRSFASDKPLVQKWKADKRTSYHKDYVLDEQGVFNYEWT
jgi:hypothetical protein